MNGEFTDTQKRALAVFTVIALLFGAYFLSRYFVLVVVAAVVAYLFTPLFKRFNKRIGTGLSATLTLVSAILIVIIPVTLVVLLAVVQVTNMIQSISGWVQTTTPGVIGDRALAVVNDLLARIHFVDVRVSHDSLERAIASAARQSGQWLLGVLQGAVGGAAGAVAAAVIFLYVFVSLLVNRETAQTLIKRLNPLGEDVTDLYLRKMGAMVRGTVLGQFVIAFCQGLAGAASVYIAGFHEGFFVLVVLLTTLSIIPLGGGIVTIPIGIGMIFFDNIPGGIFVIAWHLLVVTNIDNVLRPILVPREARLDPALMLLAVFSGITMFGFFGVIIGPVIMIVIVTTISVYLSVYKGVPMEQLEVDEDAESPRRKKWWFRRRRPKAPAAQSETSATAESSTKPAAP